MLIRRLVGVRPPPGAGWRQRVGGSGLFAGLLLLSLSGCGTPNRRLPEEAQLAKDEATKKSNDQVVHSEGGTVTIYVGEGGDRKDYFTVTWKKAEVDFNLKDAEFGGQIQEVSGTIVEKGEVQSTFVAREGSVDKGARRLNLAGGVKLTSKINNASLMSEMLAYDGDSGVIEAAKGIRTSFSGISIQGIERIAANVDLSEVWNNMKNGKKVGSLLPAVASVAIASSATAMIQGPGGLDITGFDEWNAKRLPDGSIRVSVTGTPVVSNWTSQGLQLKGAELIVTAKNEKLVSAQMKGGITFTAKQGGDTMVVTTPSATYTDGDQRLEVPGTLTLDRKTAKGETTYAKGTGGTVFIDRNSKSTDLIKTAELRGPISFKMTGTRVDSETKKNVPYFVNASGNRLTYSETERKVVLAGNVEVDGNDPAFIGRMEGIERVEITLTETREIDTISLKGDPARTRVGTTGGTGSGGGGGRKK